MAIAYLARATDAPRLNVIDWAWPSRARFVASNSNSSTSIRVILLIARLPKDDWQRTGRGRRASARSRRDIAPGMGYDSARFHSRAEHPRRSRPGWLRAIPGGTR